MRSPPDIPIIVDDSLTSFQESPPLVRCGFFYIEEREFFPSGPWQRYFNRFYPLALHGTPRSVLWHPLKPTDPAEGWQKLDFEEGRFFRHSSDWNDLFETIEIEREMLVEIGAMYLPVELFGSQDVSDTSSLEPDISPEGKFPLPSRGSIYRIPVELLRDALAQFDMIRHPREFYYSLTKAHNNFRYSEKETDSYAAWYAALVESIQ